MRDVNRIKPLLCKLEQVWLKNPHLRLGQLLEILNNNNTSSLFYTEDDVIEKNLDKELERG